MQYFTPSTVRLDKVNFPFTDIDDYCTLAIAIEDLYGDDYNIDHVISNCILRELYVVFEEHEDALRFRSLFKFTQTLDDEMSKYIRNSKTLKSCSDDGTCE